MSTSRHPVEVNRPGGSSVNYFKPPTLTGTCSQNWNYNNIVIYFLKWLQGRSTFGGDCSQSNAMDFDLSNIADYSQPDYSQFDLVKATQYGIYDRCAELVEKEGIDVKQADKENVTVLHWAAINNRLQIAE